MANLIWIIKKEIMLLVRTPRFLFAFLILLPVFTGITLAGAYDYQVKEAAYQRSIENDIAGLSRITSYWQLLRSFRTDYRAPNPGAIVVSGSESELGDTFIKYNVNNAPVIRSTLVKNSFNSLYGNWDLLRVVTLLVSFLALLMAHDRIVLEKTSGTMKLLISQPVRSAGIVIGKFLGVWICLSLILTICFLVSAVLLQLVLSISNTGLFITLIAMWAMSLLHAAVFSLIGLLLSSLLSSSRSALGMSLLVWIVIVLVIPQFQVMIAVDNPPAMSDREASEKANAYVSEYLEGFRKAPRDKTPMARVVFQDYWFGLTKDYQENLRSLEIEQSSIQRKQVETFVLLSWLSPVASLQAGMASLAGTGPESELNRIERVWATVPRYIDYLRQRVLPELEQRITDPDNIQPASIDPAEMPYPDTATLANVAGTNTFLNTVLVHILWVCLLLIVTLIRMQRYDPR